MMMKLLLILLLLVVCAQANLRGENERQLKKKSSGSSKSKSTGGKSNSGAARQDSGSDDAKGKKDKSGKSGGGGGSNNNGDGARTDQFSRTPSGNLIIPIPMNSVEPLATPAPQLAVTPSPVSPPVTPAPDSSRAGNQGNGGTAVNGGSPTYPSSAPSTVVPTFTGGGTAVTCEFGSSYQSISSSEKCFGVGTCSTGCCLYPYCLCGERELDLVPAVDCLEYIQNGTN